MEKLLMEKVRAACEKYQVKSLYLFGSAVTDEQRANDYDMLVTFSDTIPLLDKADYYFNFLKELESTLDKKVDLLTERSFKNPILIKEIEKTRIPLYEAA